MFTLWNMVQDSVVNDPTIHESIPWWMELAGVLAVAFGTFIMGKKQVKK